MNQIETKLKELKKRHGQLATGLFYANPGMRPTEWWNHDRCNDPPPWDPSASATDDPIVDGSVRFVGKLPPAEAAGWHPKPIRSWPELLAATGLSSSLDPIDEMMMLVLRLPEGDHRAYLLFRCGNDVDGWAITAEFHNGKLSWRTGNTLGHLVTNLSDYFALRLGDLGYVVEPFADLGHLADALELYRPRP